MRLLLSQNERPTGVQGIKRESRKMLGMIEQLRSLNF
jgi:hypothetical protein